MTLPEGKLPLYAGRLHFIRRVQPDGAVSVLNVNWLVPDPDPQKGVWVTVDLTSQAATLSIYDAAPDAPIRNCLVTYPFPLKEPVLPRPKTLTIDSKLNPPSVLVPPTLDDPAQTSSGPLAFWQWLPPHLPRPPQRFIQTALKRATAFIQSMAETIY